MKITGLLICLAVAAAATAQESGPKKLQHKTQSPTASVDNNPVTCAEAKAVFDKIGKVLNTATEKDLVKSSSIATSSKPVTREQVIDELSRIYTQSGPAFKLIPNPIQVNISVFRVANEATKKKLTDLAKGGFVGPIGVLAVGPKPGLTTKQFGDTVGFFLTRISQYEHMPSPRWSPTLGLEH